MLEGTHVKLSPRLPWYSLLGAVILVPLVVGVIPVAGTLVTLNAFVQPKLIVLCLTLALTLGSWALVPLQQGPLYVGRALIPLGVFLVVLGLSTVFGLDQRLAFFGDFEQGVGLFVLLLCALLAFLTAQLVRDEKHLETLTSVVVLTATAVAGIGLLQQVLSIDLLGLGKSLSQDWIMQRGYGTIGNADTYAAYLVLPALLALHRLRRTTSPHDRAKWAACLAALLMSCILAQTRGPVAGLLVGGVVYAVAERRASRRPDAKASPRKSAGRTQTSSRITVGVVVAAAAAGVLAAVAFGTATDFVARFGSIESIRSLGGRIPLWSSALKIATDHPLLGVGPDSFRLGWYPVREVSHLSGGAGLVITDPHSVPLWAAATTGIAGLLAAVYLLVATLATGFGTAAKARAGRGHGSDYDAWLCGTIALSVTLLASMITSVLAFMLFLALGVLVAPALHKTGSLRPGSWGRAVMRAASLLGAVALLAFAVLSSVAQVIAVGARTEDADLARARAGRAASLARWDTEIRSLQYETMVQSALDRVFTDQPDAADVVAQTERALTAAAQREPHEYLFPYRSALLLIGSGRKLGADYTEPGIEAGLRGLEIYPNSLELRTGVASGYLALDEPSKAEALLESVWDADPAYLAAGLTYAEALAIQGKDAKARATVSVLRERFPEDQAVLALERSISTD